MNSIQLEFDIFDSELSILDICNKCIKECKIYCISNNANIYCNRYKKIYIVIDIRRLVELTSLLYIY